MEYRRNRQDEEKRRRIRRRNLIRKAIMLFQTGIIIVLAVSLIVVSSNYNKLLNEYNNGSSVDNNSSSLGTESFDNTSSEDDKKQAMIAETKEWYLKLVNPDNSVTTDFINSVELSAIEEKYTSGSDSSKYLDERVVEAFNNMCKAAQNDGITLISVSAYRSYSYQNNLFNKRVTRCMNEGLDREAATKKAASIVAVPGTSEHHLGLAVDINSVETSFENTAAFRWLQQNAENYGFIMRYAEDKQDITKIIYEPWHYRYVGVEHAKAINDLGLCLEEYINYLLNGGVTD